MQVAGTIFVVPKNVTGTRNFYPPKYNSHLPIFYGNDYGINVYGHRYFKTLPSRISY